MGSGSGRLRLSRAMVLYPMNALVNDQLGRLRLLFGNSRIVEKFTEWSGRPARFARYTSRTLYPGVRDEKKDQDRLSPIGKFYAHNLELAEAPPSPQQTTAAALVSELRKRGKWPAKPESRRLVRQEGLAVAGCEDRRLQALRDASGRSRAHHAARGTRGATRHPRDELFHARVHADASARATRIRLHARLATSEPRREVPPRNRRGTSVPGSCRR